MHPSVRPDVCEECGGPSAVIETTPYPGRIYRRHKCLACGNRWTLWMLRFSPELREFARRSGIQVDSVP